MYKMAAQLSREAAAYRKGFAAYQKGSVSGINLNGYVKKMMDASKGISRAGSPIHHGIMNQFPVTVSNRNEVLIDQTFDARKINPELAMQNMIVYGTMAIKFEHVSPIPGH